MVHLEESNLQEAFTDSLSTVVDGKFYRCLSLFCVQKLPQLDVNKAILSSQVRYSLGGKTMSLTLVNLMLLLMRFVKTRRIPPGSDMTAHPCNANVNAISQLSALETTRTSAR